MHSNLNRISALYSLKRLDELHNKAYNLPKRIIDDEDFKNQDIEEYSNKKNKLLYEAQQVVIETRSLIKLIYGESGEHLDSVNNIYFTSEHRGYIINTFNDAHNNHWQRGKAQIISLLTNIKYEEEERLKYEKTLSHNRLTVKEFVTLIFSFISLLAIWTIDKNILSLYFESSRILAVRICLSIVICSLIAIFPYKKHWKELLVGAVITTILSLTTLLKPEPTDNGENKSYSTARDSLISQPDQIDTVKVKSPH